MTLRPTNLFRRLGQEFAYSIDTQLDAASLRRALNRVAISRGLRANTDANDEAKKPCCGFENSDNCLTLVLPLGSEFGPDDVAVRLDDNGIFWVLAEAASPWQEGDFVRIVRRAQLQMDQLDLDTARCWIEETCIVLQVDQREVKTSATTTPTKLSKKLLLHQQQPTQQPFSLRNVWPRSSLSDSKQRHGFVIKEKKVGAKWSLDLALPEFQPEEVSVTTIENSPEGVDAPAAPTRLLVTASYFATDNSSLDSTMRHEYRREVTPPTGVPLDRVVASFPGNGLLRLAAPLPSSAVKSRRTFVGLVGGSAGGAGAKIASLTRELRHVGTQRRQQQQAAGTSASLPRQTASTADSTTGAAAAAGATTANGHSTTRSGDNRSCAVQ